MNDNDKIGIVFVHGAGLGGWIWRDVLNGIDVDYACTDYSSIHKSNQKTATLDDYVDVVYRQSQQLNVNKILVIAHSIGGVVGIELTKRLGDKAAGFIGVCAAIPKPGSNFISVLPFPQKIIMPIILKLAGTRPPASAIRSGLGSDLSDSQTNDIISKFQPESPRLYTDKISNINLADLPTFYIRTTHDEEFGIKVEDSMIANLHKAKVFNIESGHMPMLSNPKAVTKYIMMALQKV